MKILRSFVALSLMAVASHAGYAQQITAPSVLLPAQKELGRIRGTAFDSLNMKPIARATIMLMDGTQTVVSDEKGHFEFANVLPGPHDVAFSTPALDSLGLGTLGTSVTVPPGAIINVNVATPSFKTLWSYRCKDSPVFSTDSGIVWGTIRDADSDSAVVGASASFSWYDLQPGKALNINEVRKDALTDGEGHFFMCGLPTGISISTIAVGSNAASGGVQYAIGFSRMRRFDLLISRDMVISDTMHFATLADSVAADHPHGSAEVRGVVRDDKKRPVANAIVEIASADTSVKTNQDGQFTIAGLPSGTHVLQARTIGFAPSTRTVDLRPKQTATLDVEMSKVNTLNTVNVRADLVKGSDRTEYEQRKRMGLGHFFEQKDYVGRVDVGSVICKVPGVQCLYNGGFGFQALMKGGSGMRLFCTPSVFIDGLPALMEDATSRPPEEFRAIEVYARGPMLPFQYSDGAGCGGILFWSKSARW